MTGRSASPLALIGLAIVMTTSVLNGQSFVWTITDVSPNQSSYDPTDPDGASGGRINNIAVAADGRTFFAASEWGGLFRSRDTGRTWRHVDGHRPHVTSDIAIDPTNARKLYATSLYDGRLTSTSGINVSFDGGSGWVKPVSATPPVGFCMNSIRRDEAEAYGISINPDNARNVVIGTNCGVAISDDSGNSWRFVDPTPGDRASDVFDVVVHHGMIDTCGADGHRRSTDNGATWTAGLSTLPTGQCSITASPDEANVLFAVVATTLLESDDGGATWPNNFNTPPPPQGRVPFVAVNQRAGRTFDLWFGDVGMWRTTCTTPAVFNPPPPRRCQANAWSTSFTRPAGGHDDVGDISFAPGVAEDACPVLFSSDGGVYYNTLDTSPACHTPVWEQPDVTPHALWLMGMGGWNTTGFTDEDLYFGTQDNGPFSTANAPATPAGWINQQCCDGFDTVGETNRLVAAGCCFGGFNRLFRGAPGVAGINQINAPPGALLGFRYTDVVARYGANSYVVVTTAGVFITTNIAANPIVWTPLPGAPAARSVDVAVDASVTGLTPVFYVLVGNADGMSQDQLWRFTGTGAGAWQQVFPPGGSGGFGIFAVDPRNSSRLIASQITQTTSLISGVVRNARMIQSNDGGATWTPLPALDTLMNGGGTFRMFNRRGLSHSGNAITQQAGYPQPTMVAFDPRNRNTIIAGGADSGVFLSFDFGATWTLLTDPNTPGTAGRPHIPRPRFAYFDHEAGKFRLSERLDIYVGSQGRGVWRINVAFPLVRIENFCDRHPGACAPVRPFPGKKIAVRCTSGRIEEESVSCIGRLPLSRACGVTFDCPDADGYRFSFDGIDPEVWDVAVVNPKGEYVASEVNRTSGGFVLVFHPEGTSKIRDYELIFARAGDLPAKEYIVEADLVAVSDTERDAPAKP